VLRRWCAVTSNAHALLCSLPTCRSLLPRAQAQQRSASLRTFGRLSLPDAASLLQESAGSGQ
jgi:hypothetical protein